MMSILTLGLPSSLTPGRKVSERDQGNVQTTMNSPFPNDSPQVIVTEPSVNNERLDDNNDDPDDNHNDERTTPSINIDNSDSIENDTQFDFNENALRIEIDLVHLQVTLDDYLDVENIQLLANSLNPNPLGETQEVLSDLLVLKLKYTYDKAGAEKMCGTTSQDLFFPKTAEHIGYLRNKEISQIWSTLKPISESSPNYYVFGNGDKLPSKINNREIGFSEMTDLKCVAFDVQSLKFSTLPCDTKLPTFCAAPSQSYFAFLGRKEMITYLLTEINNFKIWYETYDMERLLNSTSNKRVSSCSNSIKVLEKPYLSPNQTTIEGLIMVLSRFLNKLDWLKKFLYFMKKSLKSSLFSILGLHIQITSQEKACISFTQPSIFDLQSFYSFTLTDVGLASGTLIVAFLTCIHTYKMYWKRSKQLKRSQSSLDYENSDPEDKPTSTLKKSVSFAQDINAIDQDGYSEEIVPLSTSFRPENEIW